MIEFNKVTWYSRIGALVLFIGVIPTLAFYLGMQYQSVQDQTSALAPLSEGAQQPLKTLIATATYQCDGGKSIDASYYEGPKAPAVKPGEPPVPTGSVTVSLDGGAPAAFAQTISADGARYANEDGSLVFWNKGNTALIMRNNSMDLSYTNCTAK